MTRRGRVASFFASVALAWLFVCRVAFAAAPDLSASVDRDVVGEGDDLHLTFKAMSDEGVPSSPSPGDTTGFTVLGSSSGSSQSVVFDQTGRVTQKQGVTTTWTLRAARQGTFTLGPCSIAVAGKRFQARPVQVTVVAAGQAPQRIQPPNPFDPFGGFGLQFDPFQNFFDQFNRHVPTPQVETDPKLTLDAPRGTIAFLHAFVDKKEVVVGEQVTLSIYIYQDASERETELNDVHEATADDFVKRALIEDDSGDKTVGRAMVGGRLYATKLLRKWALFPLKTGDLEIGPMSLTIGRRRLADPVRRSETIDVRVTEPPVAGRPPGYVVGDTGNMSLSADTTPRDIEQDGAVGVRVELSGTGNLPAQLTPPARAGIEWLAPEVHEKMGPMRGDRYGGKRTFAFVVRLHKSGTIDLGDLTLPYYNPDTRAYAVARASLGIVNVRPSTAVPVPSAEPSSDPLAALPPPRTQLTPARPQAAHLADSPVFWAGLGASPLAYALASGVLALFRRARAARAARAASPDTDLKLRMAAAAKACRGTDPREADAAVARAIRAATLAKCGVNVRDAEGAEVSRRLAGVGVDENVAHRVEELLRDCETARFAPDAAEMASVRERWKNAQSVVGALRRAS